MNILQNLSRPLKYVIGTFVVSIILLAVLSVISYLQIRRTSQYMSDIERNYQVMINGEMLMSHMKDMETGQRGYLLTKRYAYLYPYFDAYRAVGNTLNELEKLVEGNPSQIQRLNVLKKLVAEKIQIMEDDRQKTRNKELVGLDRLELGKEKMDRIREVISKFQQTEKSLLEKKYSLKITSDKRLPNYILMLSVGSGFLLMLSFGFLFRELRNRINLQKALENNLNELSRSNSELEQFAYVASHDLQEPLRKIRAFSDRLLKKHRENLPNDGQESLDKIAKSAQRMQVLIDDLLIFSRMVKNTHQEKEVVDLTTILDEVKTDLSLSIDEKKAEVVSEPLPTISAYKVQIKQLFYNLVSNSLKFSKTDEKPKIEVLCEEVSGEEIDGIDGLRKENMFYHLRFKDNGIGFEPEYAERIFVIFQRLHGRNEYEGTGIGLAICKRVVVNHGGIIKAESQPNQGAIFDVYLPK
ncbi:MAG: sensor histidine kinase [Spirosomataceae bacterium]